MEHAELVHNERQTRSFPCDGVTKDGEPCDKSFKRKSDWARHYRIHSGERPFVCDKFDPCRKSFIQRSALIVHIRTHTGEKPHHCPQKNCESKFGDSSSLSRHKRTHSGKKPYTCAYTGCSKTFVRKTTMIKHQRNTHQRGLRDYASDSDSGDFASPRTTSRLAGPPQVAISRPMQITDDHAMSRSASFANFGQTLNYGTQPSIRHRNSLPGTMPEYHPPAFMNQSHNVFPYHKASNNPGQSFCTHGLVTMDHTFVQPQHQQHYQVPSQRVERLPIEIPYAASGVNTSMQSSPSTFSPASVRSPLEHEGFYTHRATNDATYALHDVSQDHQHMPLASVVQYHQQMPQPHSAARTSQLAPVLQHDNPASAGPDPYHSVPLPSVQDFWQSYQLPSTNGQLFPVGHGLYSLLDELKPDSDDLATLLPSARAELDF